MTTVVSKNSTTKVRSSKYTGWWKGIIDMADKGHIKLKCPEKVDPTTKKQCPQGQFVQCLQYFEAPGYRSGYINLRTCSNQKYWYQDTNGITQNWLCKEISTIRNR